MRRAATSDSGLIWLFEGAQDISPLCSKLFDHLWYPTRFSTTDAALPQAAMNRILPILVACLAFMSIEGCKDRAANVGPHKANHNPLVVIGVDGATWDVIDPMIASGELPNFAHLKARGAWGPLITVGPQSSPVIWTSFSTGQFGRRHGILDFVYPYQPGPKRPVQSTERLSPALWNLASEAGDKVSVVGYFVTYPAEKINGSMVSYYSSQKQPGSDYPADALAPIREDLDSIYESEKKTLWSRFLPWDFDPDNPPTESDPTAEAFKMVSGRVEKRILQAEYNRRAALYLAESPQDVFISYFGLVDFASHSLWKFFDDGDFEVKANPESRRLLGNVVPEAYRFIDGFIGELLAKMPENTNIVIVSDHGFGSATGIFSVKEDNRGLLTGNHRRNGVFLAAGPDISAGKTGGLTIIDVFPALAYLAGLPVADDLPGDLDLELFTDASLSKRPPVYTRSYSYNAALPDKAARASQEAQQENVKSLQGLGYVGESFELGDTETGAFDFWASDRELVLQHLVGELSFHLLKGDGIGSSELLAEARMHNQTFPVKLLIRSKRSLESIRDGIGKQAVPDSAFAFIKTTIDQELSQRKQRKNGPANE